MPITETYETELVSAPLVVPPPATPDVAAIAIDGHTPGARAQTFASGESISLAAKLNDHAARLDITAQALNGVYAIVKGLDLIEATGLTLNVTAGQAMMLGLVEVSAQSVVLSAGTTNRVWLLPNGSIAAGGSTYVPDPAGLFLGIVTTGSSTITGIDRGSVFFMSGGLPIRFSGDTFKPSDAPTAKCVHLVRTSSATWLWDGERYVYTVDASKITALSGSATLADVIQRLKDLGLAT